MNLRVRLPGAAWLSEKLLGLSAKRCLPRWRSDTFWRSPELSMFRSLDETLAVAASGWKTAVLFVDTFNGHFETENALAAARVLKAAGYTLHTVSKPGSPHCCTAIATRKPSARAAPSSRCCG